MAPGDPCALRRKAFHILWIVQIESGTETRERDLAFCETGGSAAGERSDRGLNNDDDPVQMFSLLVFSIEAGPIISHYVGWRLMDVKSECQAGW